MHFSLLSTPTVTEFRSPAELRSPAVQAAAREPQLGALTVAGVLERCGDVPHFLDANAEYMRFALSEGGADVDGFADHLAAQAVRSNADVYGLSTICSTYPLTLRVARAIKQMRPYSTILLGGPQASVVDEATLHSFPFVDFILRGEVEQSLPMLLAQWQGDYAYDRVPGLTFRDGGGADFSHSGASGQAAGRVVRTPNAPVIEDLDALPSPSYHLSGYLDGGAKTGVIELGRGCPFACTFCSTNDFFRRRFRLRSPERVLAEMRDLNARYGVRDFDLVHDMFTVDRKRVVKFCEAMAASGEGFTWNCSARTDCVDEALLEQMAASGCTSVFFGIESGSVRIQRIIDKDLDPERAERMLSAAELYGMKSTASLITGFPEENWDDLRDTLRIFTHAARCSRSHPQLNVLAPLAGTPIHTQHAHEMELEELCSDMSHQGLSFSPEDLQLIRAYPQIFPNFYMVPAPELDREVLFELRQFLTLSLELFRLHLCVIAQGTDLLSFVNEWRAWRESESGALGGSALRLYYVDGRFQRQFPRFLSSHPVARAAGLRALLKVDAAFAEARRHQPVSREQITVLPGETFAPDDRVYVANGCTVLELPFTMEALHEAIAASNTPTVHETCYAVKREGEATPRLLQITPLLAQLMQVCGGGTAANALRRFTGSLSQEMGSVANEFAAELMLGAHRAGWVEITREPAMHVAAMPLRNADAGLSAAFQQ